MTLSEAASVRRRGIRSAPPESVRRAMREHGLGYEDAVLCVSTDINASGAYDIQWLVADERRIAVFDPMHGSEPLFSFELREIAAFRTVAAVGSGLLQIRVDGVWLDLMRFSNRLKHSFDRVLKRLEQLRRGEDLTPPEADERDPQRCARCDLMLEFPGELCPRCIDHGAALGRVVQLMKPYWRETALLLLFLAIGIGLDMAWPLLTRYLVDFVLTHPPVNRPQPIPALAGLSPPAMLTLVVAALAGVQVLRAIVNVFAGRISGQVGNSMTFDIRGRLVRKLEELGLAYYGKQETGSLVGRIAYDTDAIQGFVTQLTSGFFMQFFLVVFSFVVMTSLEPRLAFWALLPAPFVIGGAFIYWRFVHPHFQRYWDRTAKQAGLLNGILTGIRVVKAFGQEENEYLRFQEHSGEVRDTKQTLDRISAYFYPLMAVVFQVGGWVIWYVGGLNVLRGQISLGTLMAFFGYLSMFYGPLGNLTNLTTWLTQFSTQVHRIFEILDTPVEIPHAEHPVATASVRGEIEFRNVEFGYSRGVPVLRDVNLRIRPGERIGIVGRSGSGKTSLINLICRFYDVDSGQVLLDGVDIRSISKQDLRSRISIVLQEPFLFRGTLLENIAYGRPDTSVEEVLAASRAASAHDFVMRHPLAYDSSVGERGQELSGGERQRISIARALLLAPPILILDEATSSIDSESELSIQMALEDEASPRTTIIIAHRLSTLQNCDRIYVIDNGRIAEAGTHRELMRQDGRYAGWVRIQQGRAYIEMDAEGKAINDVKRRTESAAPGSLPPLDGHRPRWLRPGVDAFSRGPRRELQLDIEGEESYRGVFALRCFPARDPERYLSLRHVCGEGRVREIGLIRDLSAWPAPARKLIRESLGRRYFFHNIKRIHSIRKFAQYLSFWASTDQGRVEFIMRSGPESTQDHGPNGKLLIDVEDNLYVIPDVSRMPASDREILHRYIYW